MARRTRNVSTADQPPGRNAPSAPLWVAVVLASVATLGGSSELGLVPPFDIGDLALAICALVLVAATLTRAGGGVAGSTRARRIEVPAAALAAVVLVSAVLAPDRGTAFLGSPGSGLGAFAGLALIVSGLGASWLAPRMRSVLAAAAPWILFLQVSASLFQWIGGREIHGTLSNSSYLGMVMVLCIPPALHGVMTDGRPRGAAAWTRIGLVALCMVVLVASDSRVAAVVAAAGIAWSLWPSIEATVPRAARRASIALVGLAAVGVAAWPLLTGSGAGALGTRPQMWDGAVRLIAMRPILGWGPDGFHAAIGRVASVSMMTAEGAAGHGFAQLPTDPHNVVLALAAALGLAGTAAVGWLVFECVRTWLGERASVGRLSWPAVSTLLFLATALMTPATPQTLPLFVLAAGASVPLGYLRLEAAGPAPGAAAMAARTAAWGLRLAGAAGAVILAASVSTHLYLGPNGGTGEIGPCLQAQDAARAWAVDPFLYYEASTRFSVAAGRGAQGALEPAVDTAARAVSLAPEDPYYLAHLGYVLYTAGRTSDAVSAYRRAIAVYPNSPDAVEGLGFSLLASGDARAAERWARKALELGPARASAHSLAARVYEGLGDRQRADREAAEAARLGGR